MFARDMQAEAPQVGAANPHPESARTLLADDLGYFKIGLRTRSVGDGAPLDRRQNSANIVVVETQNRRAVKTELD